MLQVSSGKKLAIPFLNRKSGKVTQAYNHSYIGGIDRRISPRWAKKLETIAIK
jgi:hypothetical protein